MDDMRDMRRLPPRNSRGEFRRRRSRRDRASMDYGEYDMARGGRGGSRGRQGGRSQGGRDYAENQGYNMDMRGDYRPYPMGDMARGYERAGQGYGYDGHHYPQGQMGGYQPIEAMGYFNGYYGTPEDYARGGRGRDYGYEDDYGDYGETLSEEELDKWCKKLKGQLDEREKQMFSKEMISQKVKSMGKQMEGFGEKELEVATLMVYTDYKQTIGQNPDLAIKLAYDWLTDKDVAVKGAEKLAVYYDEIVMGGEED